MTKERYFIWKNYEKLKELVDSLDHTNTTDSSENNNEEEEENANG